MLLINGVPYVDQVAIVTALPAGTNNIGDVDIASAIPAGTNNIGDVDIASALPAGSNTIGAVNVNGNSGQSIASFTRPDNATPYGINDVVANFTFENVIGGAGNNFIIMHIKLMIETAAIPSGMGNFILHLFKVAPTTTIAENDPFNLAIVDDENYIGGVDLATPVDYGAMLVSDNSPISMQGKLASSSTTIYGTLVTKNAYTPTALVVKKVIIDSIGV